jgi:hypothetical protein
MSNAALDNLNKWVALIVAAYRAGTLYPCPATLPSAGGGSGGALAPLPVGVTLVDRDNGLVSFDASVVPNPECAGQTFSVAPTMLSLDPNSQGYASVSINTTNAAGADRGLGMWTRVREMVAQSGGAGLAKYIAGPNWLPVGAWSIGNEYDTWAKVFAHMPSWHKPK